MPEEITDQEREELKAEKGERRKKEMTIEDILRCPTWDCDGGPEVWPTGVHVTGGELWCVGCSKCKGWISQFLVPDDGSTDPYTVGTDAWIRMRKEMGH